MTKCWIRAAFVLCVLGVCATRAEAQGVEPDAAYDAALDRALTAHSAGDFATAEAAMREAHSLSPNARTERGLGVILYAEGRYVEAIAPLEAALENPKKPLGPELRASVAELLLRIWQRVGRLVLRVEPETSQIMVDDAAPAAHGAGEIVLAPGEHRVRITADGCEPYELTLRTTAGSRDSLHVVLARAVEFAPKVNTAQPLRASAASFQETLSADRAPRQWTPLARNSLLVTGAVVGIAGGATWLSGYLKYRDLAAQCSQSDGCERAKAERKLNTNIRPRTTTGAVLMSVGAAALLVTASMELWQSSKRRAQLHMSARGFIVTGQF